MAGFGDMLRDNESLIKNFVALDFDYQPKRVLFREKEQNLVIMAMKPLFYKNNGRNVFLYGKPGIGKTVAVKNVLKAVEEEDTADLEEVIPIYINCWQRNTSYKVAAAICEELGYKFTQNKKTDELFRIIANIINKSSAAFVFDEIDKAEDFDFLYTLLESIYRKSIVLITNYKEWVVNLEMRLKSRLMPELCEFRPYTLEETKGILKDRIEKAFFENVVDPEAFEIIAKKAYELEDIRAGLHLLRESASNAELRASKKVEAEDAEKAMQKLELLSVKNSDELDDESRFILAIIKKGSGKKIGSLFKQYQESGGSQSYKTFQRKIAKLADNKFVNLRKITGGPEGTTTIVNYLRTKKLTDFQS